MILHWINPNGEDESFVCTKTTRPRFGGRGRTWDVFASVDMSIPSGKGCPANNIRDGLIDIWLDTTWGSWQYFQIIREENGEKWVQWYKVSLFGKEKWINGKLEWLNAHEFSNGCKYRADFSNERIK